MICLIMLCNAFQSIPDMGKETVFLLKKTYLVWYVRCHMDLFDTDGAKPRRPTTTTFLVIWAEPSLFDDAKLETADQQK